MCLTTVGVLVYWCRAFAAAFVVRPARLGRLRSVFGEQPWAASGADAVVPHVLDEIMAVFAALSAKETALHVALMLFPLEPAALIWFVVFYSVACESCFVCLQFVCLSSGACVCLRLSVCVFVTGLSVNACGGIAL